MWVRKLFLKCKEKTKYNTKQNGKKSLFDDFRKRDNPRNGLTPVIRHPLTLSGAANVRSRLRAARSRLVGLEELDQPAEGYRAKSWADRGRRHATLFVVIGLVVLLLYIIVVFSCFMVIACEDLQHYHRKEKGGRCRGGRSRSARIVLPRESAVGSCACRHFPRLWLQSPKGGSDGNR